MKKIISLLLFTPLLFACSNDKPYTGKKIGLGYVENGSLVNSSVSQMKQIAFDYRIDSIFYIGDDDCAACVKLKQDISGWCKTNHANVYYIHYSEITESDLSTLISITADDYYKWDENSTIPATYFMMGGAILFRGSSDNTLKYLNRYVEVVASTSSIDQ